MKTNKNTYKIDPLDPVQVMAAIEKYGLSVRQIPKVSVGVYDMRHFKDGDTVIQKFGRNMCRSVKIHAWAGQWLCMQCTSTSTSPNWDWNNAVRAKTLGECVAVFLETNPEEPPTC